MKRHFGYLTMGVLALLATSTFAAPTAPARTCKEAMDAALKGTRPSFHYVSTQVLPIEDEEVVEVVSVAQGWNPESETLNTYYYLVSATCKPGPNGSLKPEDMLFWDENYPYMGGVTIKSITKQYY